MAPVAHTAGQLSIGVGIPLTRYPPGGRGGHPSPAPTERSVQIFRITSSERWFTALSLELAAPRRGDAAWVATKGTTP